MTDETKDRDAMIAAAEDILRMEPISSAQWASLSRKMADFALAAAEARAKRECVWTYDDTHCTQETDCGEEYCFVECDDLVAHHYNFCPNCGGKIVEAG